MSQQEKKPEPKRTKTKSQRTTVFVISDLHLGGDPGERNRAGFQITPKRNYEQLARFFDWVSARPPKDSHKYHVVINGDITDFLAERPFQHFTIDQASACEKLKRIFHQTQPVWDALGRLVANQVQLTMLTGNHDLELSLPSPRRLLREKLGAGDIEVLYDNQALNISSVLIEHGNRYDPVNQVDHNALREVRSVLSRNLPVPRVPEVPGSRFVQGGINPIKEKLAFIDLLKPECLAGIILLACNREHKLKLVAIKEALQLLLRSESHSLDQGAGSDAADLGYISAPRSRGSDRGPHREFAYNPLQAQNRRRRPTLPDGFRPAVSSTAAFREDSPTLEVPANASADDLALSCEDEAIEMLLTRLFLPTSNDGRISAARAKQGFWSKLTRGIAGYPEHVMLAVLRTALSALKGRHDRAFSLDLEDRPYLNEAEALVDAGYQAIVFGHTHLRKRVRLKNDAIYLNTGTWADYIRLPDDIWEDREDEPLRSFLQRLGRNEIDAERRFSPTVAVLELSGDRLDSQGLFEIGNRSNNLQLVRL